ncbi:fasciclin domain-containing protein [Aurantiacibacter sp. MUD11]|uniref:fasciclin domain-containing protein n=1 Tax=Aurantiacibacter sp. MUD11 TaxID=3003265 RepID=UPI0022AA5DA1|nr:fasciclin domain-containing protein [Aurantiacibacter sp. MUD11]WAT19080.1 fasciclin domain-containing protein [Aurantiacibacter sp. MUD11]
MTFDNRLAAMAALALLLTGCGTGGNEEQSSEGEVSSATVASLLGEAENLSQVSDVLGDVGLQSVFDGNAPYTIFAPTDEVFAALDLQLDGDEMRAARVAMIREHIVPGFLTLQDIETAIDGAEGSVELQTMGTNTLTIRREVDGLLVTSSDGAEAHLVGPAESGVNGTIFPIDALLKDLEPVDQ